MKKAKRDGRSPRGRSPRGRSPRGRSPRGRSPRGRSPRGRSPRRRFISQSRANLCHFAIPLYILVNVCTDIMLFKDPWGKRYFRKFVNCSFFLSPLY